MAGSDVELYAPWAGDAGGRQFFQAEELSRTVNPLGFTTDVLFSIQHFSFTFWPLRALPQPSCVREWPACVLSQACPGSSWFAWAVFHRSARGRGRVLP